MAEYKKIDFSNAMAALTSAKLADANVNYAALAMSPLLDYFTKRINLAETTAATFLKNIPDDFKAEVVPVEARDNLNEWVMDQKFKMRMLSKRLGALGNKKTSAEYIAAEKEFNVLKNSFELAYDGLSKLKDFREKGVAAVQSGLAEGQDINEKNALLEFIGGEGYDRIEYRNDGVYYQSLSGEVFNVKDLVDPKVKNYEFHTGLSKTFSDAKTYGESGIRFKNLEDGSADVSEVEAFSIQNSINVLFQDQDFAKDFIFGGVYGDNTGKSKYIDIYIKEQAMLGTAGYENILDENNNINPASDSYNLKLVELQQNPPIEQAKQFLMKVMVDQANKDGYDNYLSKKNNQEADQFIDPKAFAQSIIYSSVTPARLITNRPDAQYHYIFRNEVDNEKTGKKGTFYIGNQNGKEFGNPSFHNLSLADLASLYGFDVSILSTEGSTSTYDPNLQINE